MSEPTVRKRQLGGELRRLREAAGLKLDDVASGVGMPASKVSRVEKALLGIKPSDLDALLDFYGVDDAAKRDVLHVIAR
ncbi:helix-turn-helix domain-containing protein, partial [Streptomyces sp. NPDC056291]|uniref:helix-turn-helix domain-containing protein n=1 Tax=Streptomyces sp. NPDC056291 TaxID=3345772 RepID=UPI0035DA21A8